MEVVSQATREATLEVIYDAYNLRLVAIEQAIESFRPFLNENRERERERQKVQQQGVNCEEEL